MRHTLSTIAHSYTVTPIGQELHARVTLRPGLFDVDVLIARGRDWYELEADAVAQAMAVRNHLPALRDIWDIAGIGREAA